MARRCTAPRASVPSSSLGSLQSLLPSTCRSHRPRRRSPSQRGSRRASVFKPGPFPLILMRCYPLHRCPSLSHAFSVGPIRFGLSPCLCIPLLTNRSYSSGTAEVATKTITSWSNVLDAPNEDQCGLFDVGAPSDDQRKPFAPMDNQANTVPDNAAKSFGRSSSLDAAGSEQGAKLCATAASNTCPAPLIRLTPTYHSYHDGLASTFCRVQDHKNGAGGRIPPSQT